MSCDASQSSRAELARTAGALVPELRRQLASEWARAAQFEHASIASFGRFALELLAVGAPPQLVADAHRAALDEIRHAQLCFGIASAYAGETLGPGPLAIEARMFTGFELQAAVRSAVIEGCVGETLAAVEAQHACALTQVPPIRSALSAIAREESEHASLAYRFVGWAVRAHGAALQATVQSAFDAASRQLRALDAPAANPAARVLEAHGRLCERERHVLRLRALDQLIAPLAHELSGASFAAA
jgi:hypothetical protein